MYLLVDGNINLGRGCPQHNHAVNTLFSLEAADILADLLGHVPAVLYGLDVVAVQTLGIVVVESGLHRHDLLELFLDGQDILFLEHLAVDSRFVSVGGIYVPCAEHDVVERCDGHDLVVLQIFLFSAAANTDFVVLSH